MADYAYPNRIRAHTALLIYRDAMRRYIADALERAHGEGWFDRDVLEPLGRRTGRAAQISLEAISAALRRSTAHHLLIEQGNIAFLIDDHLDLFHGLRRKDVNLLHHIRSVRNEFLEHDFEQGDCGPEVADAITGPCIIILDRCGLAGAAEQVRRLSPTAADTLAPNQTSSTEGSGEQKPCLCGCGFKTKNTFMPGHEGRLERIIRSGTTDERSKVDWHRVPLSFCNGDYAEDIRRYRNLYPRNSEDGS